MVVKKTVKARRRGAKRWPRPWRNKHPIGKKGRRTYHICC